MINSFAKVNKSNNDLIRTYNVKAVVLIYRHDDRRCGGFETTIKAAVFPFLKRKCEGCIKVAHFLRIWWYMNCHSHVTQERAK